MTLMDTCRDPATTEDPIPVFDASGPIGFVMKFAAEAKRNAPGPARLRRFRGKADINQPMPPADSVENDPELT